MTYSHTKIVSSKLIIEHGVDCWNRSIDYLLISHASHDCSMKKVKIARYERHS